MSTVTHDIVAKLWNLCNVLKDDGVTYYQYVSELTYLLFLKMAKETGTEDQIPAGHRWDDLEAKAAHQAAQQRRLTENRETRCRLCDPMDPPPMRLLPAAETLGLQ